MRDGKCVFLLWLGVMFSLAKSNMLAIKSVADRRLASMVCAWYVLGKLCRFRSGNPLYL